MPARDFTKLCKDAMAGPLRIDSEAGEPGIEDISILEVAHTVLGQEIEEVTINVLVDKLMETWASK